MARYLVRRGGAADTWMVWDRDNRRPAEVDGKRLAHLTAEQAEAAFSNLTGRPPRERRQSDIPVNNEWQVTYGSGATLPCAHEVDAKLLARELVKRGHRVSAKTVDGVLPARLLEPHQIYAWLRE
jgi:hypothetical protein